MACLDHEGLSAYADGEGEAAWRGLAASHLEGCGRCRDNLALLEGLRARVRALPAPAMPDDLRVALDAMAGEVAASEAPRPRSAWAAFGSRPLWGLGLAAAAAGLAVALWPRGPGREDVPLDLLLEAHSNYELTMPLAETEAILSGLPDLASGAPRAGGPEEADVP